VPLFSGEFLDSLRLLPTEYAYYYYRSREAFENVRDAGKSRGQVIEQLNARLFNDLAHAADPVGAYEEYLAARNAGYMQIESGSAAPPARSPWAELTGYDKIALAVVRAIHLNSNAIIPLNVQNNGNLPELEAGDTVELPCVVNVNGARALHAGRVPERVRDLLMQVKAYERLTVQAGLSRDPALARQALAANPLVNQPALAARLLEALQPL
jgi:6-phospho-beta-glucosidase